MIEYVLRKTDALTKLLDGSDERIVWKIASDTTVEKVGLNYERRVKGEASIPSSERDINRYDVALDVESGKILGRGDDGLSVLFMAKEL